MDLEEYLSQLQEYAERLIDDAASKTPVVPSPVVWAFQAPSVREAIAKRLQEGQILVSSSMTIPDLERNLERAYFDFAPPGRLDVRVPGILVELNDDNSLHSVVDPVDLSESTVLARPDMDATLPLYAAASYPLSPPSATPIVDERFDEFVREQVFELLRDPSTLRMSALGGFMGGFGNVFGGGGTSTRDTTSGTPTLSPVISNTGSKEDPDQDVSNPFPDDSSPDDFAVHLSRQDGSIASAVFPGGPPTTTQAKE